MLSTSACNHTLLSDFVITYMITDWLGLHLVLLTLLIMISLFFCFINRCIPNIDLKIQIWDILKVSDFPTTKQWVSTNLCYFQISGKSTRTLNIIPQGEFLQKWCCSLKRYQQVGSLIVLQQRKSLIASDDKSFAK